MTTQTDEYQTRLRSVSIPIRGWHAIGECIDCNSDVYLEDDAGTARCEGCGQAWRIGVLLIVERLEN